MNHSYQDNEVAKSYLEFMNSTDGQIQQELLYNALIPRLEGMETLAILDAGCGDGWLIKRLRAKYKNLAGCDLSPALIDSAKIKNPDIALQVANICQGLPFAANSFNTAILNMVAHDLQDQKTAFQNIAKTLKPDGKLLMTIINPYYAFPAGQWKRGFWQRLCFKKPRLILHAYNLLKQTRPFLWKKNIPGLFYTLPETINTALGAGFKLTQIQEITAAKDSKNFDLTYRLYRFPILLFLVFEKTGQ